MSARKQHSASLILTAALGVAGWAVGAAAAATPVPATQAAPAATQPSDLGAPATQPTAVRTVDPVSAVHDRLPLGVMPRAPGPAPQPAPATDGAGLGWLVQTAAALAGVVGLILLLRWVMARWSASQRVRPMAGPVLEVLARVTVAPRNHIVLVRLGHRVLVLGDSPAGLRSLGSIRDPDEIATLMAATSMTKVGSVSAGFRDLLQRFHGGYERGRLSERLAEAREVGADEAEVDIDRARDSISGLLGRIRRLESPGDAA